MSAPPLDLFLDVTKEALQDARSNKRKLTLVLGKDQPDLDSIASAVIFAYFRTASPAENAWSPCYIPILNELRADLLHLPILMRVLPHASISLQHLITFEDLATQGTRSGLLEELTRFFFVDHNLTLGREKQNYSEKVIGCIDHNEDENYVPQNTDPEPRIIGQAGSCTSLVVNFSRQSWESLDFYEEGSEASFAKLGLAAILVDTKDLTVDTTEEDINAVEFLLSRLKLANRGRDFDRTGYYYEIIGEERPRPLAVAPRVQYGPELPPDYGMEPIPEPTPVVIEEPEEELEEPLPEPEPIHEPVKEIQREPTPEVEEVYEPEPEPIPEPVIIEPVFVDTSPAALAQPEPLVEPEPEPVPEPEPAAEPIQPVQRTTTTQTLRSVPRVYLADVLAHNFEQGHEGGGAIGITFTPMGLAEMILHAERDLVERAIEEAANDGSGATTNGHHVPTDEVMRGTPFTAAVRQFALERGLSVYAIRTDIRKGNELFIWVFENSMAYYIPRFVQNRATELGLERWGTDEDEIGKEPGMKNGMMAAYWMRSDPGRDAVKKAIMGGTTYVFFGSSASSTPMSPRFPKRTFTGNGSLIGKTVEEPQEMEGTETAGGQTATGRQEEVEEVRE